MPSDAGTLLYLEDLVAHIITFSLPSHYLLITFSDAGTLLYLEDLVALEAGPAKVAGHGLDAEAERGSDTDASDAAPAVETVVVAGDPSGAKTTSSMIVAPEDVQTAGKPHLTNQKVYRQTRERRAERWRKRLPLLDEDPREEV